ncbi:hypothetical protein [Pedobacter sp.]|uniref:hypothetical protein n=1 Tax=Pedobacter sp. TaxID=1411316 RepID=UPI003BA9B3EA
MKIFLTILLFLPLTIFAQRGTENFGKFTNTDGAIIKGDALTRGYERQLEISNLVANSANNNNTISFAIPISTASGVFRNALNGAQKLRSAEITVTTINAEKRTVTYKINLEDIAVNQCADRNGFTNLQLTATRIGWTYFATDRMGRTTVSSKNGWDAENKKAWVGF